MDELETIEDVLRADLDDLDSDSEESDNNETKEDDNKMEEEDNQEEQLGDDKKSVLTTLKPVDANNISRLRKNKDYVELMKRVRENLDKSVQSITKGGNEYKLIVNSNQYISDITEEIFSIQQFVIDHYSVRFPELEKTVVNPTQYLMVVKKIGNNTNIDVDKEFDFINSSEKMMISVVAASLKTEPLPDKELSLILQACEEGLELDKDRDDLIKYVSSRMKYICPNVNALLGPALSAKIVGKAGGLEKLSNMPSCNILLLGQLKQFSSTFLSASAIRHKGFVYDSDIIQECPAEYRTKACRLLSNKLVLAARYDLTNGGGGGNFSGNNNNNNNNSYGEQLLKEIKDRIEKWQEPQKCKTKKILPPPDQKPTKRRGGKRIRKRKELLGMTEMRKRQNRIVFGNSTGEYGDTAMGFDFGSLNQEGTGNIRILKKEQKIIKKRSFGLSGKSSGFSSSFAITPVQGLELKNPDYKSNADKKEKYFSSTSGFSSVAPK